MADQLPAGYRHIAFDLVDSTNEEARRQIHDSRIEVPTWISSISQSAGRGRQGRSWHSEAGNLFCSLALPLPYSMSEAARLSFVAALAVVEVCDDFAEPGQVNVKWPNDVLIGGRKVAGILLETEKRQTDNSLWLIVGIGINVGYAPAGTAVPAVCLSEIDGKRANVDDIFIRLAGSFDKWYRAWRQDGFELVRKHWLSRAAGLHSRIQVRLPRETLTGIFTGLDKVGALKLRCADGTERTITAGDVFFDDDPI